MARVKVTIMYILSILATGYSFHTIDPSDSVDDDADAKLIDILKGKIIPLPWNTLGISFEELKWISQAHPIQLAVYP